jgi:hypothetical protein
MVRFARLRGHSATPTKRGEEPDIYCRRPRTPVENSWPLDETFLEVACSGGAEMTDRIAEASPRFKARMAGLFYVLTAGTSVFGQMFVLGKLVVEGDAAATAAQPPTICSPPPWEKLR